MDSTTQLLKETEVARLLGFHVQTLRNQRFAGTGLPYFKIGRAVRYDMADIERYLDERRIKPRSVRVEPAELVGNQEGRKA